MLISASALLFLIGVEMLLFGLHSQANKMLLILLHEQSGHYISTLYITYVGHYIGALFNLSFMFINCHKR